MWDMPDPPPTVSCHGWWWQWWRRCPGRDMQVKSSGRKIDIDLLLAEDWKEKKPRIAHRGRRVRALSDLEWSPILYSLWASRGARQGGCGAPSCTVQVRFTVLSVCLSITCNTNQSNLLRSLVTLLFCFQHNRELYFFPHLPKGRLCGIVKIGDR